MAFLAVAAFLELVLNRVISRLLHLEFLQPRSSVTRAVDDIGLFVFELTSVLAVLLLSAAVIRIAAGGDAFRPGARLSIPLIGTVFDVLAMLGILVRLPPNLQFHLQLSFFFLCLLLVMSVVASHASARVKAGTLLVMTTFAIKVIPSLMVRTGTLPESTAWRGELPGLAALGCLTLASVCFLPRKTQRAWVASVTTWVVVCAAAVLIRSDWDTAARVALYGFGVELPVAPWAQLVCLAALAAGLYASLRLLLIPGTVRLRGYGLLLIGLGGLHLELPGQLALAALGMFCLAASAVRIDGTPLPREALDRVLQATALALGTKAVTVTGEAGDETARVHAPAGETPTEVVLQRRQGVVIRVEVSVGDPPPRDPPFSLERKHTRGLGPTGDGARVETEDPAFDAAFDIRDKRGAGAPLLDDAGRQALLAEVHGWLAVWPQRGVRYRAEVLPAGDDGLARLTTFLRDLQRRTA